MCVCVLCVTVRGNVCVSISFFETNLDEIVSRKARSLVRYAFQNSPKLRKINFPLDGRMDFLPFSMFRKFPQKYRNMRINFRIRGYCYYDEQDPFRTVYLPLRIAALDQLEKYFVNGNQSIVKYFT